MKSNKDNKLKLKNWVLRVVCIVMFTIYTQYMKKNYDIEADYKRNEFKDNRTIYKILKDKFKKN